MTDKFEVDPSITPQQAKENLEETLDFFLKVNPKSIRRKYSNPTKEDMNRRYKMRVIGDMPVVKEVTED